MLSSKCSGGRLDAAWLTSLMGAVKARGRAAQARKSWLPASLVVVTEALERGGAGDVALPDSCQDVDVALPLVVVRRGLGEAPRYRRRAPPNRRQTAAAHCKRAGGILKPPPLLGV